MQDHSVWRGVSEHPHVHSVISARHDVVIVTAAHAGDGNLHPVLITPRGDDAARRRARAAFDEITRSTWAAPSAANTVSACSSGPACAASWTQVLWPCTTRSSRPSTHAGS